MVRPTGPSPLSVEAGTEKQYADRVPVKRSGRVRYVRVEEVDWFEARRNYVFAHSGEDSYALRKTMKRMEAILDPGKFIRIHRSAIVNLDRIRSLRPLPRGQVLVVLYDGSTLSLSRSYRGMASSQIRNLLERPEGPFRPPSADHRQAATR